MSILGSIMNRLGVPPMVERVELDAETCGVNLSVRTSPRYTILTIDGHELFFERETGRYDGFGGMQLDAASCTRAAGYGSSPVRA